MNIAHLQDEALLQKILSMWLEEEICHLRLNTSSKLTLLNNSQHAIQIIRTFGKIKVVEKNKKTSLKVDLVVAQLAVKVEHGNISCQSRLFEMEMLVTNFENLHEEGVHSIL